MAREAGVNELCVASSGPQMNSQVPSKLNTLILVDQH